MTFSPQAAGILQHIFDAFPGLTTGTGDQQRFFMRLVVEQIVFETRDFNYGLKSADRDRPQGPSEIAYQERGVENWGGWRVIDGDGSATGVIGGPILTPPWQSFKGQWFIPCSAIDHLSNMPAPREDPKPLPPPASVPPSPAGDVVAAVMTRLDRNEELLQLLAAGQQQLREALDELHALANRRVVGKVGPVTIVLSPEGPR